MNNVQAETISDKKLIEQIAKRNDLAFGNFYDRHWDALFIAAYKVLKDEEICKDIVQEIFLGIWESQTLNDVENVRAYLLQAVRFKVLMTLRKNKISDRHLATIRELTANTTEDQLYFQELNDSIQDSINALPDKCQEIFRLSRFENLSNKEIAEKMNISVRTVETHISNALRSIRSKVTTPAAMAIFMLLTL